MRKVSSHLGWGTTVGGAEEPWPLQALWGGARMRLQTDCEGPYLEDRMIGE